MEKLFKKLHFYGGAIVRECDVTPSEKTTATQNGDVFVDGEGLIFVWVQRRLTGIGWGE